MTLILRKECEGRSFSPFTELDQLERGLARVFANPWSTLGRPESLPECAWAPAMDVHETADGIVVKADLPGLDKEGIRVQVNGDVLTVEGEKKREAGQEGGGAVRRERWFGSFKRSLSLPGTVDAGKIRASYKNGVLELMLPKREESKPKEIKIDIQ